MIPNSDFHDKEYMTWCAQQFEAIRISRKNRRGPIDSYERINIQLDKAFESFYKGRLNDRPNKPGVNPS